MSGLEIKAWFGQQVETCMDSLYGFSVRLTGNPAEAEDLVADAITKAWSAIATLDDKDRFRPWLFRIAHNTYISEYRKRSVRPIEHSYHAGEGDDEDELTSLLIGMSNEFLYWWGNPEQEFANKLLGKDIVSAIERLPEVYRTAILLVNVDGMSYDEAAEVLGVPPGTIRSRMKRGRTLLQKELWEHAKDAGLIAADQKIGA